MVEVFDWLNYLTLAERLLDASESDQGQLSEADMRAAVSRAYYAAFQYTKTRLISKSDANYRYTGPNSHEHMWNYVGNKFESFNGAVSAGKALKRLRIKCDYEDVIRYPPIGEMAAVAVRLAHEIIDSVDEVKVR